MSFLLGALLGAGGGYAAALLLAPQKGEETQQVIKTQKEEIKLQAMDQLEKAMEETEERIERLQRSLKSKPVPENRKDESLRKEAVLIKKEK